MSDPADHGCAVSVDPLPLLQVDLEGRGAYRIRRIEGALVDL
jgi:hypothetical protein